LLFWAALEEAANARERAIGRPNQVPQLLKHESYSQNISLIIGHVQQFGQWLCLVLRHATCKQRYRHLVQQTVHLAV
jgi:hypothetical protein